MSTPLLEIRQATNGYGGSQVLFDMALCVQAGQCVSLQGRNGMGKTTTLKSIMGLLPLWQGEVLWQGQAIHALPPHRVAQLGVGLVPEGRQIFPNLTVWENLVATASPARAGNKAWNLERVYAFFPRLAERQNNFGNQLSGGEQQMLAIGRALMTNPQLLILDEATEGLSPLIREEIWAALKVLRNEGLSILVTDKNMQQLITLCDMHYVMEKGRCVWSGDSAAFREDASVRERYLAV
ncbi:ABC transporter ATP-binding protein [Limnohabitans sp. B9-3]|uniref:ABC transporter ATP-binding protein n=1 Tax=Limnohabitans sp. B9-3 TaxID=1100707 RepID=UPI000C1ED98B|nr:ABC transporter ATP-binding protein [Limnohabitans sp. B9-3]PIT76419.1 ABC transporter ATP-binding protein [Limnohabitans sp. B9-3]